MNGESEYGKLDIKAKTLLDALILKYDKTSEKLKEFIVGNSAFNYSFANGTKAHFYEVFKFRYDRLLSKGGNEEMKKNLELFLRNLKRENNRLLRLNLIHTPDKNTWYVYTDLNYEKIYGLFVMATIEYNQNTQDL